MITLAELATICGAKLIGNTSEEILIAGVFTDSRRALLTDDRIFVALRGEAHNGADYIPELYRRGFRCFLTSTIPTDDCPEATFLLVDDTLSALQRWASYHRSAFQIPLVGITGSNGKTIVKEWLSTLLESAFQVVKSPRSYNSQVGVPLSVLRMQTADEYAVFEAGISQPGEMEKLAEILHPECGVFTNIGQAHQANFSSLQHKAEEKAKLFNGCTWVLTKSDDPYIIPALLALPNPPDIVTIGKNDAADWNWKLENGKLILSQGSEQLQFHFPFSDAASVENGLYAIVAAHILGCSQEQIDRGIRLWQQVEMRMEFVQGPGQRVIVNDAYNSDPESLKMALDFLHSYRPKYPKMVILSDFVQGDPDAEKVYRKVGRWIDEHQPDACFAVGEQCNRYRAYFPKNTIFFTSTEALLEKIDGFAWENATVLVKGARAFALERVVYRLGLQTHRTILDVNLSAMERNLRYFRSKLPEKVKMMGMVKAFSYGVGAVEIARFLEYQNIDYLAVAYIDEGLELRKTGITLPILVLNPDPGGFPLMHEYLLEPEIYSFSTLEAWKRIAHQRGDQLSPIHLKIDTGMNRLGFSQDDLPDLLPQLRDVSVATIMSHLVASDDVSKKDFTENQIRLFDRMAREIESSLGYTTIKHILNSSGIANYPKAAFDMVRLGIGLYGGFDNDNLSPALRWRAHISQIRTVEKGVSIGYGGSFHMPHDGHIAVITVGYGDGFRRLLSNGVGKVYIRGKACPVVGKVCMDMTMVDVTNLHCSEGDEVEIFGENQSLFDVAKAMDTIPYEVLTGISPRVQRVYYRE